jgi:hypothetical protein
VPSNGQFFCATCEEYLPSAPLAGPEQEGVMVTVIHPSRAVVTMIVPDAHLGQPLWLRQDLPNGDSVAVTYEGVEYVDRQDRTYWIYFSAEEEP